MSIYDDMYRHVNERYQEVRTWDKVRREAIVNRDWVLAKDALNHMVSFDGLTPLQWVGFRTQAIRNRDWELAEAMREKANQATPSTPPPPPWGGGFPPTGGCGW